MELASNIAYFLTQWTYIANATNGIFGGIMSPINGHSNGTLIPMSAVTTRLVQDKQTTLIETQYSNNTVSQTSLVIHF